nr:tetratricopeptide repeat protein [Gemmatimonadota bacterium]
ALSHAERSLEIDPLSPNARAEHARALLGNGRCDEALAELEELAKLRPPLLRAAGIAAHCYARRGMWPAAVAVLRPQAGGGGPASLGHFGAVLARAGQREEALRIRATLLERWRRGAGDAFDLAVVDAGLGDRDQAFVWLERSIADRSLIGSPGHPGHLLIMGPLFDDLRRDPRFERLRERLGLQKR